MYMVFVSIAKKKKKGSQGILLEMISEPRQELFYLIHIEEAI